MRKLTVINHVTLDGVMQAPARPDEDTRGGFSHGGWALAGNDEVMARFMGVGRGAPVAHVLGRRTYEGMFSYWPQHPDNPYTQALILGSGRRLFPDGTPARLRLSESVTTTTGVVIARYQMR